MNEKPGCFQLRDKVCLTHHCSHRFTRFPTPSSVHAGMRGFFVGHPAFYLCIKTGLQRFVFPKTIMERGTRIILKLYDFCDNRLWLVELASPSSWHTKEDSTKCLASLEALRTKGLEGNDFKPCWTEVLCIPVDCQLP